MGNVRRELIQAALDQGLSYRETAELLGCSKGTITARVAELKKNGWRAPEKEKAAKTEAEDECQGCMYRAHGHVGYYCDYIGITEKSRIKIIQDMQAEGLEVRGCPVYKRA